MYRFGTQKSSACDKTNASKITGFARENLKNYASTNKNCLIWGEFGQEFTVLKLCAHWLCCLLAPAYSYKNNVAKGLPLHASQQSDCVTKSHGL